MKKFIATVCIVLTVLAVTLSMSACGNNADYLIGISQVATHGALDAARDGFIAEMDAWAAKNGKKIKYNLQNANGDSNNETTIADTLKNANPDLILGIATSTAQKLAGATTKIPVLFTAVTDPVDAGLTASANVTGTSDLNPVAQQIELIKDIVPNVDKIAFVYCSGEPNSQIQVNLAKTKCEELGIQTVDVTATTSGDLQTVLEGSITAQSGIDAIYVPTDNLLAANMGILSGVANPLGIPVITGEAEMCEDGEGLATFGIDYNKLGRQTAKIAIKILEGTSPADIPFEFYTEDCVFFINENTAAAIGIDGDAIAALKTKYGA